MYAYVRSTCLSSFCLIGPGFDYKCGKMDSEQVIPTVIPLRCVFGAWPSGIKTPSVHELEEARTNCRFSSGGTMCKYSSADHSALLAHEAECPARAAAEEMYLKDGLTLEDVDAYGNVIRDVDVLGNVVRGGRKRAPPNHKWHAYWVDRLYGHRRQRSRSRSRSRSR